MVVLFRKNITKIASGFKVLAQSHHFLNTCFRIVLHTKTYTLSIAIEDEFIALLSHFYFLIGNKLKRVFRNKWRRRHADHSVALPDD